MHAKTLDVWKRSYFLLWQERSAVHGNHKANKTDHGKNLKYSTTGTAHCPKALCNVKTTSDSRKQSFPSRHQYARLYFGKGLRVHFLSIAKTFPNTPGPPEHHKRHCIPGGEERTFIGYIADRILRDHDPENFPGIDGPEKNVVTNLGR